MRGFIVCILILSAGAVEAKRFHFEKRVNRSVLVKELKSAGFAVLRNGGIGCKAGTDRCWIWLADAESKNPQPIIDAHVYVDPRAAHEARLDSMKSLLAKWKAGTISAQEKDDLLRMLVEAYVGE